MTNGYTILYVEGSNEERLIQEMQSLVVAHMEDGLVAQGGICVTMTPGSYQNYYRFWQAMIYPAAKITGEEQSV